MFVVVTILLFHEDFNYKLILQLWVGSYWTVDKQLTVIWKMSNKQLPVTWQKYRETETRVVKIKWGNITFRY